MRLTRGCRAGGGVACSSLEYGGIRAATRRTPAPHGRLLPPDVASSSSSSFISRSLSALSRPHFPLRSPRNIGAVPAAPSCCFLVSSYRLPISVCADNSGDDNDVSLRRHCHRSSSKAIGKMDRRKGTDTQVGKKKYRVFILFRMMH